MKFDDYQIAPEIKRSLEENGFKRPTDIQFKTIPHVLLREDVLAIAQTGTGKTAAFAIPTLHLVNLAKRRALHHNPLAVVMVPTHELALQITKVFEQFGKYLKISCLALFGGTEQDAQINRLNKGVDIVIATPGRLFDLRSQGHLKLSHVEILILDEADHMLDLGFYKDVEDLIKHLPAKRQTLFFSATINDKIKKLAYSVVTRAVRIQVSPKDPVSKNITHTVAFVNMDDKRFFMERIVKQNPENKILIFVRTKVRAERVHAAMKRVGIESATIHSDKDQQERSSTMTQFSNGQLKILIATDVSARGIDIPNVDFVVNYDLPDVAENYVHRIGRTGRGVHKGNAISFCSDEEKPMLQEIETYMGKNITTLDIAPDEYEETIVFSDDKKITWKDIYNEIETAEQEILKKRSKKG